MPWYVLHQANVFRLGIFRERLPQHCKVTEIFRNHNYFLRFFQTRKTRKNVSPIVIQNELNYNAANFHIN